MSTGGQMGRLPEWYPVVRAARYLGVAPWDLQARPACWMYWALCAEGAENEAMMPQTTTQKEGQHGD